MLSASSRPAYWLLIRTIAGVAASALLFSGCFIYSFSPRGAATIKSTSIPSFENNTPELDLAEKLTIQVTDAFIADGSLKLLPSDLAETTLKATLTSYQRVPYQFDQSDQVSQYRVVIGFTVTLVHNSDGTELWTEQTSQEGVYNAADESEEDGRARAAARLVEFILNKTTKSW